MVGWMEIDRIEPPALPVVGSQHRRLDIGEPRRLQRLLGQHEAAEIVEILAHWSREILGYLDQQRIAAPGVAARYRRWLVGYLVRHALSLTAIDRPNPPGPAGYIAEAIVNARPKYRGEAFQSNALRLAGRGPAPYSSALT